MYTLTVELSNRELPLEINNITMAQAEQIIDLLNYCDNLVCYKLIPE